MVTLPLRFCFFLLRLKSVMQRPNLKDQISDHYTDVYAMYTKELERIQKVSLDFFNVLHYKTIIYKVYIEQYLLLYFFESSCL